MLHDIAYFFAGAVLANAIPHLVSGLSGHPFQSPFAKPPGQGLSSATVNVLWGFANLVICYVLLSRGGGMHLYIWDQAAALGAGVLLAGVFLARSFGPLHGGNL